MSVRRGKFFTAVASASGFTLLEILVALTIAAVGIAAATRATHGHVGFMQIAEDRVIAGWVASNYLSELRLGRQWRSSGESRETVSLGGRNWYIIERVSLTADPDIARVDLTVFRDRELAHRSSSLFGFLARPHRDEN